MCPRPGGEADKFGTRYEARWTVQCLLKVLLRSANAVTAEPVGVSARGVDLLVERMDGGIEAHQVKRQNGLSNGWTLSALNARGVLSTALEQTRLGHEFVFVSAVPCRSLDELTDRARRSGSLATYAAELSAALKSEFEFLSSVWGDPVEAYSVLRLTRVRFIDERALIDGNADFCGQLLVGASGTASAEVLAGFVVDHLGHRLDAGNIEAALHKYGITIGVPAGGTHELRAVLDEWWLEVSEAGAGPRATILPGEPEQTFRLAWHWATPITRRMLGIGASISMLAVLGTIVSLGTEAVQFFKDTGPTTDEIVRSPAALLFSLVLWALIAVGFFRAWSLAGRETMAASRWSTLPWLTGWDGRLGFAKLRAACVICGGRVRFRAIDHSWVEKADGARTDVQRVLGGQCARNPEHQFTVDATERVRLPIHGSGRAE